MEPRWVQWTPPYDPRHVDGAIVTEDAHHRLIETADCGTRCPGCGICCAGYRDVVTGDYFGEKAFAGNLQSGRGGLVELESGLWYRVAQCGTSCPGYGQCCPPVDLRQSPQSVADARHILLEKENSQRWEMQEALLLLSRDGSDEAVATLEAYVPRAHARLEGLAQAALEDGRFTASIPRTPEQERALLKREVRQAWQERAAAAQCDICENLEPERARREYELALTRQLLEKAQDDADRETWQTQIDVLGMLVVMAEEKLDEQQEELAMCEAMLAEIAADMGAG